MEEKQNSNALLDLILCLRRHILGMILIFTAIVAVVVVTTLKMTPVFEVESKLLVKYGREYVYHSMEKLERGDVSPMINYDTSGIINTELEIFRSNELADEVVNSVGVDVLFPDLGGGAQSEEYTLALAVASFGQLLDVTHIKGSNVINVALQHTNPKVAVQAVKDLIERFIDRHLEVYKNPQVTFLEEQVERSYQVLQEAEEAKRNYKQGNLVFALRTQREIVMQQYANVKADLVTEQSILNELREKQISLETQLATVPEDSVLYEEAGQRGNVELSESKLLQLKVDEHALLERYPENNRAVVAIRKEIELVEKFLGDLDEAMVGTVRTGKNELFAKLERDLMAVEVAYQGKLKKIDSIAEYVAELENHLQEFSDQEIPIKRLNDDVVAAEVEWRNFRDNLAKSRVQAIMDSEKLVNIVVIDEPRMPLKPVKPRKRLRVLIGIILGAACSFLYALFREYVLVPEKQRSEV